MPIVRYVPNKFLCHYSLSTGVTVYAITFAIVQIICIIVVALQMMMFSKCEMCSQAVLRSAYGFSGAFIITCVVILLIQLWFLCPTNRVKSSKVLVWVVTTATWLGQTFCLTLVLLCLYMNDVSLISWLLSFIFGFLAFGIAGYGVLVGIGLYKEIKTPPQQQQNA